jgi:putative membrane protein
MFLLCSSLAVTGITGQQKLAEQQSHFCCTIRGLSDGTTAIRRRSPAWNPGGGCAVRHVFAASMVVALISVALPAMGVEESVDQKFAADAAKDGMAEVQLGKLALNKSDNVQVREFANRMIQDHTKANTQLESIAKSGHVVLPSEPGKKLTGPMDKLSGLSSKEFDQAYIRDMVRDHEEAVKLFQRYERDATNAELRRFAQETLPTLREHLAMAQKIETSIGK